MKVLHIAALDLTIFKFRLPILDALKQEGLCTHVASSSTMPQFTEGIRSHGHTFHPILIERALKPVSTLRSVLELTRLMRREQFDVVHTHTPIGGAVGRTAAILARAPVILHTTGGLYFHENMSPWRRRVYILAERLLARRTDVIFSVNQEDISTAYQVGIRPRKGIVYSGPAGVDVNLFPLQHKQQIRQQVRAELGLDEDALVVGMVGRLEWEKGAREFLEAASRIHAALPHKVRFVWAGDGPREEEAKAIAQQLGIQHVVHFLGWREDTPRVLMSFDLLLFPSYREGLPIAVIEAMAAAVPVVAFRIRGCREAMAHEETGLLVPFGDVQPLADAAIRLLNDPAVRQQFGTAGRQRVSSLYTRELHVERQLQVYREVMARRMSPAALPG